MLKVCLLKDLYSSVAQLIDELIEVPEYRKYVPLLSSLEYILDAIYVSISNEYLNGKATASRTASKVLP